MSGCRAQRAEQRLAAVMGIYAFLHATGQLTVSQQSFKKLLFFFFSFLRLFHPVRVSNCYSTISLPFIPFYLNGENEPWLYFGVL